jgi:D-glycero-D-manno-heptose 1,7-bisphosphate phosphatase
MPDPAVTAVVLPSRAGPPPAPQTHTAPASVHDQLAAAGIHRVLHLPSWPRGQLPATGPVLVHAGGPGVDLNLRGLLAWHRARKAEATVVLCSAETGGFGDLVDVDVDGRLRPTARGSSGARGQGEAGFRQAGICLLSRTTATRLSPAQLASLEEVDLAALVGDRLFGFTGAVGDPDPGTTTGPGGHSRRRRPEVVLLDRDGTIQVNYPYLRDPAAVELLPGALQGLRRLQRMGLQLVVVTNQSGVGRGLISESELAAVHHRLRSVLAEGGVTLAGIFHCPHTPDTRCRCRKPRDGLVRQAQAQLGFDPAAALIAGDSRADVEMGRLLGVPTVLVAAGQEQDALGLPHGDGPSADLVVDSLDELATILDHHLGLTGIGNPAGKAGGMHGS